MPALALRLSDRQLKAVKAKDKDYVLSDGDGLQLRVRSNGSMLWNFNYREPVTKNRINMGLGTYPELSLANARKKVVEARELLAQGIDPKVHRSTERSQTSGDGTYVRERGHRLVRAEEGLRHAGVRRRHLAIAHAARISRPENNAALENYRTDGHRTASPNRGLRQPRDSEAIEPTAQRDHDLRGQFRTDLCEPPQWHSRSIQETQETEHGRATT